MIMDQSYRKAFFAAVFIHLFLATLLLVETTNQRPVMTLEAKNEPSQALPLEQPHDEVIKAVSVDNQEVMQAVNRLKQERTEKLNAERTRQQALTAQAEMARKARVQEQQRLQRLKEETERIAIARKKQMEEEQRHLKELALQKEKEAKRLKELKEKQQEEAAKLAQLKAKEAQEKAKADKDREARAKLEKAKADKLKAENERRAHEKKVQEELARAAKAKALAAELAEKQRQAAALQAAQDAAKRAQIAGEVDKYKAMIVNAIGRRWILPENVGSGLSSQFRIRLAPDGAVLDVILSRSSGDPVLDRSAQTAIFKASPLPVPTDPGTFDVFRDITLTVRPENVR